MKVTQENKFCVYFKAWVWPVQYSTVQYSTVQYSAVQYSTVQCSTVQYTTERRSTYFKEVHISRPEARLNPELLHITEREERRAPLTHSLPLELTGLITGLSRTSSSS